MFPTSENETIKKKILLKNLKEKKVNFQHCVSKVFGQKDLMLILRMLKVWISTLSGDMC